MTAQAGAASDRLPLEGVEAGVAAPNQRQLRGWHRHALYWFCVLYTLFHLAVLNLYPLETWTFRILHVAGGLVIAFVMVAARGGGTDERPIGAIERLLRPAEWLAIALAAMAAAAPLLAWLLQHQAGMTRPPVWLYATSGPALALAVLLALPLAAFRRPGPDRVARADWALVIASMAVALYLLANLSALQFRAGVMPTTPDMWAALAGIVLILEVTRRVAGWPLVVIALVFILYAFVGPWLPGFLAHSGYQPARFFTYVYTDNGILGPTTAVSSTYIILFIAFAAFLQASRVGEYFVNFAFAVAGRARGGPAKVAVFASGLMGMINGTSAGNVVATGSLTIPLMKRVGYAPRSAAAIEAAASTGGQIMPPVMGAGAFIMAEITGIPYLEICAAALIPALLYFLSIYFMVDLEAARTGMRGLPANELPQLGRMLRQVHLFVPIVMLIVALVMGYSVIRAGTLSLVAAVVVSWLTVNPMGPRGVLDALEQSSVMAVQLIAVCACAGIIVGVIGLTGVGLRFSSMLLGVAAHSQLLALLFAMGIAILLGMGMPTTAAYAVAASVVAPGLIQLGIEPLVAHLFVFYFAVISAITPPVALAAYAGAAIAGSDPMRTSVTAFVFGIAAFIVPFMFFYGPGLLLQAAWPEILRNLATASIGVYLLAAATQGWLLRPAGPLIRVALLVASLAMIEGGILTDLLGISIGLAAALWQWRAAGGGVNPPEPRPSRAPS